MYSNNSYYWLDGETVDVAGLSWVPGDPDYYTETHLILAMCEQWVMADWEPMLAFRVLCEI